MNWPELDELYIDEFGQVDAEVHNAAGKLWPNAERFALSTLGDEQAGLRLMIKASAIVSRRLTDLDGGIDNLTGFLQKTYRRLVLAELKKLNGRRVIESEIAAEARETLGGDDADVEKRILIEELWRRMDHWTKRVFELRTLGYAFEQMEAEFGMKANVMRARFSREVERLRSEIEADSSAAEERIAQRNRGRQ